MTQANRTEVQFSVPVIDVSTTGLKFTTPAAFGNRLGALQAIKYKRSDFRAFNDSDAAITVALFEGANQIASHTLAAGAAAATEVDVGGISGAAALTVQVTVDTAGTGTGQAFARLDVEQPVLVGGC